MDARRRIRRRPLGLTAVCGPRARPSDRAERARACPADASGSPGRNARYTIEWREVHGEGSDRYGYRLERPRGREAVVETARAVRARAWNQEFRVERLGREVYTNLHALERWAAAEELPSADPHGLWRRDLARAQDADRLLLSLGTALVRAVAAGVLLARDRDLVLRAVGVMVRRPLL